MSALTGTASHTDHATPRPVGGGVGVLGDGAILDHDRPTNAQDSAANTFGCAVAGDGIVLYCNGAIGVIVVVDAGCMRARLVAAHRRVHHGEGVKVVDAGTWGIVGKEPVADREPLYGDLGINADLEHPARPATARPFPAVYDKPR